MADIIDQTNDVEQSVIDLQIRDIRNRGRELEPEEMCHWCDEPFPEGSQKLFCNDVCSRDHARYNRK